MIESLGSLDSAGPGLEQLEDSTKAATGDVYCVWQWYPLVMTNMALENHRFNGEIHYTWRFSIVKLPEGKGGKDVPSPVPFLVFHVGFPLS